MASAKTTGMVQKMYVAYYGRPGDPGGVLWWAEKLDEAGGQWTEEIINAFGESSEYTDHFGGLGNGQLIDALYQQIFGRAAEPQGKAYWLGRLANGELTLAEAALEIINGAQGEDLTTLNNKLVAADAFTRVIDPELDGQDLQATYDADDLTAARGWLGRIDAAATVTLEQVFAHVRDNIADPGDPILGNSEQPLPPPPPPPPAPRLVASTPVNAAGNVAPDADLVLTFSEAVRAGSGNIILKHPNNAGGDLTIPVTDASQVSIDGEQVTINPSASLAGGVNYSVLIPAGAFTSVASNTSYAGITNAGTLAFTTQNILTTNVYDEVTGTDGDETFTVTDVILQATDQFDGGAGTDTLSVASSSIVLGPGIANIEALVADAGISGGVAVTGEGLYRLMEGGERGRLDSGRIVTLTGSADADTIALSGMDGALDPERTVGAAGCTISGVNGDDRISLTGGNGADGKAGGAGEDGKNGGMGGYQCTIQGGLGADVVSLVGGNGGDGSGDGSGDYDHNNGLAGEGGDGGNQCTIATGDGDDTITLTGGIGGTGYAYDGESGSWFSYTGKGGYGARTCTIDAGTGNDAIRLSGVSGTVGTTGALDCTINGGEGDDTIVLTAGNSGNYGGGNHGGDHCIINGGAGADTIMLIGGNKEIHHSACGGYECTIDGGDGADTITLSGGYGYTYGAYKCVIKAGDGDDIVRLVKEDGLGRDASAEECTIDGGNGSDTINCISKFSDTAIDECEVNGGSGDDLMTFTGGARPHGAHGPSGCGALRSTINGGEGDDSIALNGGNDSYGWSGGSGGGACTIDGGAGDDSIILTGGDNSFINGGHGGLGCVISGGVGNDIITLTGGNGDGSRENKAVGATGCTLAGGAGADIITITDQGSSVSDRNHIRIAQASDSHIVDLTENVANIDRLIVPGGFFDLAEDQNTIDLKTDVFTGLTLAQGSTIFNVDSTLTSSAADWADLASELGDNKTASTNSTVQVYVLTLDGATFQHDGTPGTYLWINDGATAGLDSGDIVIDITGVPANTINSADFAVYS